jgi:hypothetical protein
MYDTDWIIPALMAFQITMKQGEAFDQAPLAKMRPTQLMQTLGRALCLYKGTPNEEQRDRYTQRERHIDREENKAIIHH